MPNFEAQVRTSYQDMTGLVLDCRSQSLSSDEGTHDGSSGSAYLEDSTKSWAINALVGMVMQNVTDGSYAVVTANTATTVTGTLTGGTDNDWDSGDAYSIVASRLEWPNSAPAVRYAKAEYDGSHDGSSGSATLSDSTRNWEPGTLVGMAVYNVTDGSLAWITANTATTVSGTLTGGTDNDWDSGDAYSIREPRFGNPYQATAADQPVVLTDSGWRLMEFTRTRTQELHLPLDHAFPPTWWTIALEMWKGSATNYPQAIFRLGNLRLRRRNAAGNYSFNHGATEISGTSDQPDGVWLLQGDPLVSQAEYFEDGLTRLAGSATIESVAAGDPAGYVGCDAGSNYFEGRIRTLQLWDRPVSDLEVDFAFKSLSPVVENNQNPRCDMELRIWTDVTGDYQRINPQAVAAHRFHVAKYAAAIDKRIQIAAAVAGKVRRDAELGGKLFQLSCIESPAVSALCYQDAGWSAVYDIVLNTEGHYSWLLSREGGGGVIIHVDAENA